MAVEGIGAKIERLSKTYNKIDEPKFVKSGSLVFDAILGGGVPQGCFILLSSGSGIGKSTAALYICKSFCVQGKKVLYLDFEGGVNISQLDGIGVSPYVFDKDKNPKGTFYSFRLHTYTDAEAILEELLDVVDLVILDSVTAILPGKLREKSVEDVLPGLQARMMANLLIKYKSACMKKGTTWIMINQMRTHIRFIGQSTEEEAGGLALKFYSDYRILMKEKTKLVRKEKTPVGEKEVPYGSINEIWAIKSRYSRPYIPLKLAVIFGNGISNNHAYYDYLEFQGCIKKEGSWYTVTVGEIGTKAQGEGKIVQWIQENQEAIKKYVNDTGGYRLLMSQKGSDDTLAEAVNDEENVYEEDEEAFKNIDYGKIGE